MITTYQLVLINNVLCNYYIHRNDSDFIYMVVLHVQVYLLFHKSKHLRCCCYHIASISLLFANKCSNYQMKFVFEIDAVRELFFCDLITFFCVVSAICVIDNIVNDLFDCLDDKNLIVLNCSD
jgi:hypothetical protein